MIKYNFKLFYIIAESGFRTAVTFRACLHLDMAGMVVLEQVVDEVLVKRKNIT